MIKFPEIKILKFPWDEQNLCRVCGMSQTILDGISQNVNMYFVHSYILKPKM